ncbi:MAG: formate dehydrogenase subunit alpha [Acidobacteria bacterium]|nr:formate dehydrogenase subunit alpha [Acidobacteriota bacterium]
MVHVHINNKAHEFTEGLTVLQALREVGIDVPTLCQDERLKPAGDCRMCLVEIAGWSHPVTSCNTLLTEGMKIVSHSPKLETERRSLLAMFADRYPPAPVHQFPDKPFHRYLREYDLNHACYGVSDPALVDDSHPYIRVDMTRCIDCYRCVRICAELQGQFVWEVLNRGAETRIVPDSGSTLLASSCVSCGACVDTCPTGALEDQSVFEFGTPTQWTRTTCPYCGTGCEMNVGTRQGCIVEIKPSLDAPVNKGHLCVKGRYSYGFVSAADRITSPMIREAGEWRVVSWDEAIRFTADRLRDIVGEYGPDSVGVLGSARATNEENYLAQKFARVVLGTNNVDCCARVCHGPTATAMKLTLGTGAATNSYDDIERAETILVCGANPTENHPIIGARIKQAALRGTKLIVIDPRNIELAQYADIHLALRPGTNVPLLNAMACTIFEEGLYDERFLAERVAEAEEFREFTKQFAPETVAAICGVEAEEIRRAARLYATTKPAMCVHGLGMTEHTQGTDGVMCLVNLALLTGNVGKPGAGINPLRGQNNVQGSAHMGCEPSNLTGYVSIPDNRELFERVWRAPLPVTQGLNLMEMMDAADAGKLKALWGIGYDVLLTNANVGATRRAMAGVELVIVQDMFLNETAREFGTVFLPAASPFEKDGTFMNAERRIQRIRKAVEPPGEAKSDWEIICLLARAMGNPDGFQFESAEEIWDEVRTVWKAGRGISYARLEHAGLQWPCPDENHPGTQMLHTNTFPLGDRATLRRVEFHPTHETVSDEFPLLLVTGRTLAQFNAGTMTMRTNNVALRPTDTLDISPSDAESQHVRAGDCVRLLSRYGEAILPIRISTSVKPGELFATFHTAEAYLNCVTSPHRDAYTGTPEYKVTAVRIEKLYGEPEQLDEKAMS